LIKLIAIFKLFISFAATIKKGGLAQLARALAWHARGHRFDSDILHQARIIGPFFMSFYLYILYSVYLDQYYVGHTDNLEDRLFRHNNSGSKSTKKTNDWELKYQEPYPTRSAAMKREAEIKKKKSRKYIEKLIAG
jgi:putative endonuclease